MTLPARVIRRLRRQFQGAVEQWRLKKFIWTDAVLLRQFSIGAGNRAQVPLRSEGDGIVEALDEAFRIGREAKIPVEIWHLKAAGKPNWRASLEIH